MKNVFISKGASLTKINLLAEWARETISKDDKDFDIIRFIEIDLRKIFPGLYVHIEDDRIMGLRRAFISDRPLAIVVSESTYEGASRGCLFSQEVILHEVGHLFLHYKQAAAGLNSAAGPYVETVRGTSPANSAEWQATSFALCFLFPAPNLEQIQNKSQIMQTYRASDKQAERIIRHVRALRIRQSRSDTRKDTEWLKKVTKTLTSKEAAKTTTKLQSQLLLFFANKNQTHNKIGAFSARPPASVSS